MFEIANKNSNNKICSYVLTYTSCFFRRGFHWPTSTSDENLFKLYHLKYFIEFVYFVETIQPKTYMFHASSMQMTSNTRIRVFDGGCLMTKTDRQQKLIHGWNGPPAEADWWLKRGHHRRLVDGWNRSPAEAGWWLKRTTSGGWLIAEPEPSEEVDWCCFFPLPSI